MPENFVEKTFCQPAKIGAPFKLFGTLVQDKPKLDRFEDNKAGSYEKNSK